MTKQLLALLLLVLAATTTTAENDHQRRSGLRGQIVRQLETAAPSDIEETEAPEETAAPTDAATMAATMADTTAEPTMADTTAEPTEGASTDAPSTESPTGDDTEMPTDLMVTDAPSAAPMATDSPTEEAVDTRSQQTDSPTVPLGNDILDGGEEGEETTDGPVTYKVQSELDLQFFAGKGRDPDEEEKATLIDYAETVFTDNLAAALPDDFLYLEVTGLVSSFDANTDMLVLTFETDVGLVEGTTETEHSVAKIMPGNGWNGYITTLMRNNHWGVNQATVTFTGHGRV